MCSVQSHRAPLSSGHHTCVLMLCYCCLEILNPLPLSLCCISEAWWDNGTCAYGLEPWFVHSLSSSLLLPRWDRLSAACSLPSGPLRPAPALSTPGALHPESEVPIGSCAATASQAVVCLPWAGKIGF